MFLSSKLVSFLGGSGNLLFFFQRKEGSRRALRYLLPRADATQHAAQEPLQARAAGQLAQNCRICRAGQIDRAGIRLAAAVAAHGDDLGQLHKDRPIARNCRKASRCGNGRFAGLRLQLANGKQIQRGAIPHQQRGHFIALARGDGRRPGHAFAPYNKQGQQRDQQKDEQCFPEGIVGPAAVLAIFRLRRGDIGRGLRRGELRFGRRFGLPWDRQKAPASDRADLRHCRRLRRCYRPEWDQRRSSPRRGSRSRPMRGRLPR